MNEAPPAETGKLGFSMTLALVMGTMIGSGVFLLPTSLAPYGWNALYGWVITIGGALCLAYVMTRLVREMPGNQGPIGAIENVFGPLAAFLIYWSFVFGTWVAVAALATAAVSYLSMFAPEIARPQGAPALLAVGVVWLVTAVNLMGTRSTGGFQVVAMALKSLPLVAVMAIAAYLLGSDIPLARPYVASEISLGGIASSAALALWAMTGFEVAAVSQSRVADAARVVPRATLVGALATGIIYIGVCMAIVAYMPASTLLQSNAPFADFIALHWAIGPAMFVALFAAISAIGSLNGNVLMMGEVPRVMAEIKHLPRWFAKQSSRGAPIRTLVISTLIVTALLLMNYSRTMAGLFTFMALLSTSVSLIFYFTCAAAALRLVQTGRMRATPGLIALIVIGMTYAVWTFYGVGLEATGWSLVFIIGSIPFFFLFRRIAR